MIYLNAGRWFNEKRWDEFLVHETEDGGWGIFAYRYEREGDVTVVPMGKVFKVKEIADGWLNDRMKEIGK